MADSLRLSMRVKYDGRSIRTAWDVEARKPAPPMLFGHEFDFTDAPQPVRAATVLLAARLGLEAQPRRPFAMWNPNVVCPA